MWPGPSGTYPWNFLAMIDWIWEPWAKIFHFLCWFVQQLEMKLSHLLFLCTAAQDNTSNRDTSIQTQELVGANPHANHRTLSASYSLTKSFFSNSEDCDRVFFPILFCFLPRKLLRTYYKKVIHKESLIQ